MSGGNFSISHRVATLFGGVAGHVATVRIRRHARQAAGIVGFLLIVNAAAAATAEAAPPAHGIRALAENVLGRGTVKSVRLADEGATVVVRWESATYKPANRLAVTRELLYAEAALATGAILGPLQDVRRIQFTIVNGKQIIASGETWRVRGLLLAYVAELGGGTYAGAAPAIRPAGPGAEKPSISL